MARVVNVVNHPIGESQAPSYANSDFSYDYALAGIPFNSAVSPDTPFQRETAQYKKDQIDTTTEPGEQTITSWWLRSQSSFHGGAGITFAEAKDSSDLDTDVRFNASAGVNVFTPGKVTLLPATTNFKVGTPASALVCGAFDGSTPIHLYAEGNVLKRRTASTSTTVTWGGSGTILAVITDGANYYVADAVGIWKGTLAGGAGAKIYNTGTSSVVLGWAKQRLMAGIDNKVYELDAAGGGGGPTLPTAKYTHPVASWVWTCFADTPGAIMVSGYAGANSAIFKFVLDSADGTVPTLTSGIIAAQFPVGEVCWSIYSYVGSFLGIGTSKGVRISGVAGDTLSYGPLIATLPAGAPPVKAISGRDRFLYAAWSNGIDGKSGLLCVDLSHPLDRSINSAYYAQIPGPYAYSTHLQSHVTGQVTSVSMFGDLLVFAVSTGGLFTESATDLETSGYLQTGRIRFHTLEPKLFEYLRVRAAPLVGTIKAQFIDAYDTATFAVTYALQASTTLEEAMLPASPYEFVSLKFTLTPQTTTTGPELRSYQVKAAPAGSRQRIFNVPMTCFDLEADRFGVSNGRPGYAIERLRKLEAIEDSGRSVLFQHLTSDPEGLEARLVTIDKISFTQQVSPQEINGWGGVVVVTLRSVT